MSDSTVGQELKQFKNALIHEAAFIALILPSLSSSPLSNFCGKMAAISQVKPHVRLALVEHHLKVLGLLAAFREEELHLTKGLALFLEPHRPLRLHLYITKLVQSVLMYGH